MTPEREKSIYYKIMKILLVIWIALAIVTAFLGAVKFSVFCVIVAFIDIMFLWAMDEEDKYKPLPLERCTIDSYMDDLVRVDITSCCKVPVMHDIKKCSNCGAEIIRKDKEIT